MFPRYLLIGLLFVSVGLADPGLPDDFEATYHSLAGMIDVETLTPLEMARGTYDATRFFAVGKPGVPLLEQHYRRATTLGQATLAGLYLTVWGQQRQFDMIRAELERNKTKRRLIYSLAGTEPIFFSSLTAGAQYQPLLRLMPSVGGTRTLTRQLLDSPDALVRRSGLFWGFWLADGPFWGRVKEMASADPDPTTRRVAGRLLQHIREQAS
jgi:hypothetical protein